MAAVARSLPPPRLVPPRPTPKSVPPPLPQKTDVDAEEVMEVSDTAVHELVVEEPAPKPAAPVIARAKTAHPGVLLLRTIAFFFAELGGDGIRYFKAHWVRAAARARR